MPLVILSPNKEYDVLKALASVVKHNPATEIIVTDSLDAVSAAFQGKTGAILSLGPKMLEPFAQMGTVPKNRTVTSLRKVPVYYGQIPVLFSYSIGISEVDYKQFVDLLTDTALAFRLAMTGTTAPQYGDYQYVSDLKGVVAGIQELLQTQKTVDLAFDTETLGLDRFHPDGYLVSLQFSYQAGMSRVVAWPSKQASLDWLWDINNQHDLGWLLNDKRIKTCAANGKYDLEWLYEQSGIECTNFTFDTTTVGSLLDENRSNGLDVHAKIYTPLGGYSDVFDKTADKSRMDLEYAKDPKSFILYSGGDSDATWQVKQAEKEELVQDQALAGFYINVLHPALRAFEQVERGGVCIDMNAYGELETKLRESIKTDITKAKNILGGMLVAKHYDPDKPEGINLTKASLIKDFMFSPAGLNLKPKVKTEKTGEPSTSMEHLELFKDVPEAAEFVNLMSSYSSASKTLNTYVTGFKKHIRSDGKFHPTYYLFAGDRDAGDGGTNTGRVSVKDPAFQTIPKHTFWGKLIRQCFPAPEGMLVLESDYSQGELKVVACLAYEENMINAYRNGLDLHVVTSGTVSGFSYEEMMALKKSDEEKFESIRQLGKAGNFGLVYGMGVEGFMEYARLNYGVKLSVEEATEFRTGFFNTYPQLLVYHDTYKKYAHKHGYVRSPLGRVRHLPLINSAISAVRSQEERRSINSPVQGALSDMMLWAIAIQCQMGWFKETPCFGAIHDAGYYYIPEDHAEFYAKRVVEVMENLPFEQVGWKPQLKFTADAKIGPNMGDLKKLKFPSEPIPEPVKKVLIHA